MFRRRDEGDEMQSQAVVNVGAALSSEEYRIRAHYGNVLPTTAEANKFTVGTVNKQSSRIRRGDGVFLNPQMRTNSQGYGLASGSQAQLFADFAGMVVRLNDNFRMIGGSLLVYENDRNRSVDNDERARILDQDVRTAFGRFEFVGFSEADYRFDDVGQAGSGFSVAVSGATSTINTTKGAVKFGDILTFKAPSASARAHPDGTGIRPVLMHYKEFRKNLWDAALEANKLTPQATVRRALPANAPMGTSALSKEDITNLDEFAQGFITVLARGGAPFSKEVLDDAILRLTVAWANRAGSLPENEEEFRAAFSVIGEVGSAFNGHRPVDGDEEPVPQSQGAQFQTMMRESDVVDLGPFGLDRFFSALLVAGSLPLVAGGLVDGVVDQAAIAAIDKFVRAPDLTRSRLALEVQRFDLGDVTSETLNFSIQEIKEREDTEVGQDNPVTLGDALAARVAAGLILDQAVLGLLPLAQKGPPQEEGPGSSLIRASESGGGARVTSNGEWVHPPNGGNAVFLSTKALQIWRTPPMGLMRVIDGGKSGAKIRVIIST